MAASRRHHPSTDPQSMIRKNGNHFCEKIMLKPLNLREFFSTM
jgi:hypothetical protein